MRALKHTVAFVIATLVAWVFMVSFVPPESNFYSISDGHFSTYKSWSQTSHSGMSCSCGPGCDLQESTRIFIQHQLTFRCSSFKVADASEMTVHNGGSLNLSGDYHLTNDGRLSVEQGCTLTIQGDLTVEEDAMVKMDGHLVVTGGINFSGNGYLCGTGSAQIMGRIQKGGLCDAITVLPLELKSFSASYNDEGQVALRLEARSGLHNDLIAIERSDNGLTFEQVVEILAGDQTSKTLTHDLVDENPLAGTSYYRVRQTAFNGHETIYPLVAVSAAFSRNSEDPCSLTNAGPCFPNCDIDIRECEENGVVEFTAPVYDIRGNLVHQRVKLKETSRAFNFHIDPSNNLTPSIYVVSASALRKRRSDSI